MATDENRYAFGQTRINQLSPYLNVDPSIFRNSEPQYIIPEGLTQKRGRLEYAFGHIGGAVCTGYAYGSAVGLYNGLVHPAVKSSPFMSSVWRSQMLTAHVNTAPAYARPFGIIMLQFSVIGIILSSLRGVDDDINTLIAGAATGALYKVPQSITQSAMRPLLTGSGIGLLAAVTWAVAWSDSRARLLEMVSQKM